MPNSKIVCVDASLVVRMLQEHTLDGPFVTLWRAWRQSDRMPVAPTLMFYELANALRRYVIVKEMTQDAAANSLNIALQLSIELYGDPDLHRQALSLAARYALPSVYDAHYLVLAERLGAEFWTADRRLYRAVSARCPGVHLVGEE